jgi:hypothetical protein
MSNDKLKTLLASVHSELEKTDVDDETRSMLKSLDSDIHQLLSSEQAGQSDRPVVEQAGMLEARFASEHPVAERFMREIIDTLVKLGV